MIEIIMTDILDIQCFTFMIYLTKKKHDFRDMWAYWI